MGRRTATRILREKFVAKLHCGRTTGVSDLHSGLGLGLGLRLRLRLLLHRLRLGFSLRLSCGVGFNRLTGTTV